MKEADTQTFVAAWPGPKDRRAPKWLAAFSSYYAGALAAITVLILLRLSLLTQAMTLGLYVIFLGAGFTSWCCSLLTGASGEDHGMLTLMLRYFHDVWLNPSLSFTYLAGLGPAVATQAILYSIWNIGIAYTTVYVIAGNVLASLSIDYFGLGWNHPKKVRPSHVQAGILLVLGAAFLQFDIFPVQLDEGTQWLPSFAAFISGILFTCSSAALAELSPLFCSRSKAMTVSFTRATLYMPVFIFLLVPTEIRLSVIPVDNWELWVLMPLGSISLALTCLSAHVGCAEGATTFTLEFWMSFSVIAALGVALGYSSLPPRSLDLCHFVGFGFLIAALVLMKNVSKMQIRRQLAAIPNRRHGDEQCQICVKNDTEISRLQQELQELPNNIYDPSAAITAARHQTDPQSAVVVAAADVVLPIVADPREQQFLHGEPKSGPIRGL